MKINWKIRLQNKTFWVTIVSAIFVFITAIASAFCVELDLTQMQGNILSIVEAVFSIIAVAGVVIDTTTKGTSDSDRALGYNELG